MTEPSGRQADSQHSTPTNLRAILFIWGWPGYKGAQGVPAVMRGHRSWCEGQGPELGSKVSYSLACFYVSTWVGSQPQFPSP